MLSDIGSLVPSLERFLSAAAAAAEAAAGSLTSMVVISALSMGSQSLNIEIVDTDANDEQLGA